jgi:hypothetical protein
MQGSAWLYSHGSSVLLWKQMQSCCEGHAFNWHDIILKYAHVWM